MQGDENINKFCELIVHISSLNHQIETEKEQFYDGGHSFEECNTTKIQELVGYQEELKALIKLILI